ncbi:MAG: 16S rRNA processing protein RimM [Chloroflexi bacterium]|nr:16S rRNA processing protein RimM [Chloroflexota bacterium]
MNDRSSTPSVPEHVTVGRVLAPWGTGGQVRVEALTDFPGRLAQGSKVYIGGVLHTIESSRPHKGNSILKLSSIDSVGDAEKLRLQEITVLRSEIPDLPAGQYYHFQVLGLKVKTIEGDFLGEIVSIMASAGSDIYVVRKGDREMLLPAIEDVVKSVDLERGEMVVEVIEGLL